MELEFSNNGTPYIQIDDANRLSFSKISKANGTYNRLFFSGIEVPKYKGEPTYVRLLTDMQMEGMVLKTRRCLCFTNGSLKSILKRIKKHLDKDGLLADNVIDNLAVDISKVKIKPVKPKKKRKKAVKNVLSSK